MPESTKSQKSRRKKSEERKMSTTYLVEGFGLRHRGFVVLEVQCQRGNGLLLKCFIPGFHNRRSYAVLETIVMNPLKLPKPSFEDR